MKTAKEMFEELGYILYKNERCICIIKVNTPNDMASIIVFDLSEKVYELNPNRKKIDIKIHKAINKQIEELGW